MVLHHHTKFGNKMFCGSEDIIRETTTTTFTGNLNSRCDLDPERSNQSCPQDILACDAVYQTKFGCKRTSSSEEMVK